MDDAEHVLVSMGSLASESTLAADSMREKGLRTGVVGVRAYRPFPADALDACPCPGGNGYRVREGHQLRIPRGPCQ